jgi:hypothetical protein
MQIEIAGQRGWLRWEYLQYTRDVPITTRAVLELAGADSRMQDGTYRIADAYCSLKDKHCKEIGRKISLTRLLANMNLTKQQRREVWNQYRNRRNH